MSHQLINRDHLQTCSGGDLAFEQELLALYVTDAREQLAVIEAAMATGDWGTVQRAAHQLKGTSSNLGIESNAQCRLSTRTSCPTNGICNPSIVVD